MLNTKGSFFPSKIKLRKEKLSDINFFLGNLPNRGEQFHVFLKIPKCSTGLVECSFDNPDKTIPEKSENFLLILRKKLKS